MKVTLYSNDCPCCRVQKAMLEKAGIDYTVESDVDRMLSMGLTHLPMLDVDGQMMDYQATFKWLNERTNTHAN